MHRSLSSRLFLPRDTLLGDGIGAGGEGERKGEEGSGD